MRRRNIKSVAHWVIMSVVLLFPILMVGISSFGNHETINVVEENPIYYETNDVETSNDLLVGNIYHWSNNYQTIPVTGSNFLLDLELTDNLKTQFNYTDDVTRIRFYIYSSGVPNLSFEGDTNRYVDIVHEPFDFVIKDYLGQFSFIDNIIQYFSASEMKLVKEYQRIEYQQNYYMREDVNQWCTTFRNLPVNQWYGSLLSNIGLGITNSMMMNVIYTYPLYVLWVYILDLIVDIFLVIINLGHNALKRLGGDNE